MCPNETAAVIVAIIRDARKSFVGCWIMSEPKASFIQLPKDNEQSDLIADYEDLREGIYASGFALGGA